MNDDDTDRINTSLQRVTAEIEAFRQEAVAELDAMIATCDRIRDDMCGAGWRTGDLPDDGIQSAVVGRSEFPAKSHETRHRSSAVSRSSGGGCRHLGWISQSLSVR